MIVLDLKCGLGNQLFEYAYARSLLHRLENQDKIGLITDNFARDLDGRSYKLNKFSLPEDTIELSSFKQKYYFQKYRFVGKFVYMFNERKKLPAEQQIKNLLKFGIYDWNFDDVEECHKGSVHYLRGVFQNYRVFHHLRDELKQCFTLKNPPTNEKIQHMLGEINGSQSVAMHIRRGDYVDNPRWSKELLVCTESYYFQAFRYIKQNIPDAKFFVFSNNAKDLKWIKENYTFLNSPEVTFVDCCSDDIEDFYLMKNCKHHVISNSSFSWWAQYLCDNNDSQLVAAPAYWDTSRSVYPSIYMDNWHCIEP